jgi:pyruvyl transferase EpsO
LRPVTTKGVAGGFQTSSLVEFCVSTRAALVSAVTATAPGASATQVGYCDFANVGDNLISVAEDSILRFAALRVVRVVSLTYDAQPAAGSLLALQGGGNLGDLWLEDFEIRVRALERAPGAPVVVFPQSVFFSDRRHEDRFRAALATRRTAVVLLRDRSGFDWANEKLDHEVRLVPDSAFALGPLERPVTPTRDILVLARTDKEALDGRSRPAASFDWITEPTLRDAPELWPRDVRRRFSPHSHTIDKFLLRRLATVRLRRGLALLSSAHVVVTDRLHGVIACVLAGIPVVALDNSYGKVFGFIDTWDLPKLGTVAKADSFDDAVDIARSMP